MRPLVLNCSNKVAWRRVQTFDTEDPLTPFLAYVLFVLHYRNNPFSDSWLIFKHSKCEKFAIGNELL